MSDSRAKYEEIKHTFALHSSSQREVRILLDILQGMKSIDTLEVFVEKARTISKDFPNLSPLVVYQMAADGALVDELCS